MSLPGSVTGLQLSILESILVTDHRIEYFIESSDKTNVCLIEARSTAEPCHKGQCASSLQTWRGRPEPLPKDFSQFALGAWTVMEARCVTLKREPGCLARGPGASSSQGPPQQDTARPQHSATVHIKCDTD